jgi:hypothetical protein
MVRLAGDEGDAQQQYEQTGDGDKPLTILHGRSPFLVLSSLHSGHCGESELRPMVLRDPLLVVASGLIGFLA